MSLLLKFGVCCRFLSIPPEYICSDHEKLFNCMLPSNYCLWINRFAHDSITTLSHSHTKINKTVHFTGIAVVFFSFFTLFCLPPIFSLYLFDYIVCSVFFFISPIRMCVNAAHTYLRIIKCVIVLA